MTNRLSEDEVRAILAERPDVVGVTAITPSIYKAERLLQIAKELHPHAVTVLGGIHGTFMYQQVLTEAPWIDAVVRGEGEEIFTNLIHAVDSGEWTARRPELRGIAYRDGDRIVATAAAPTVRDPKKVVDEIETLIRDHDVGFFILADEEPTINRRKFVRFCEELIARDLGILWGINTRVTDVLRDEALLPLYRKAGLIHVSLGTEAAAQMNLDRFNKETTIAQNKKAVQLLREAGIVVEAQFIVGLENETVETLEETYRMALDRATLLDRVMHNYRRFYIRKALFSYPWAGSGERRLYLLGCLKAFLKAGFERRFYDLGKVNYWGPQAKRGVRFDFDTTRTRPVESPVEWKPRHNGMVRGEDRARAMACGGGDQQLSDDELAAIEAAGAHEVVDTSHA